jgi:hypothetical protein
MSIRRFCFESRRAGDEARRAAVRYRAPLCSTGGALGQRHAVGWPRDLTQPNGPWARVGSRNTADAGLESGDWPGELVIDAANGQRHPLIGDLSGLHEPIGEAVGLALDRGVEHLD